MKSTRSRASKSSRRSQEPNGNGEDVPVVQSTSTRLSFLESPSIIIETASRTLSDSSQSRSPSQHASPVKSSATAKRKESKSRSKVSEDEFVSPSSIIFPRSPKPKICRDPLSGVSYILYALERKEESPSPVPPPENPPPSKQSTPSSTSFHRLKVTAETLQTEQLCSECSEPIKYPRQRRVKFNDRFYHRQCFLCVRCRKPISGTQSSRFTLTEDGRARCAECDLALAKTCHICHQPIVNTKTIVFETNAYHPDCFRCGVCDAELDGQNGLYNHQTKPYCTSCHTQYFAPRCFECGESIMDAIYVTFRGAHYHRRCFYCIKCREMINVEEQFYNTRDGFICKMCDDSFL